MEMTLPNNALIPSEYSDIYESNKLISKALDNNCIDNVEKNLKTCKGNVYRLTEADSFGNTTLYDPVLLHIQRQLKRQLCQVRSLRDSTTKPDTRSSATLGATKLINGKPENVKGILDNCAMDVKGQGFETIAGLEAVKAALTSSVILPFMQPQLYDGLRPSNCVLLFGPPGTGKTKLAMAVAAEAKAQFISITSGDISSHYFGKTEKNISSIFQYMKASKTPTILFIDEIDALCRSRTENEPDHARRIKTEILCQISGFGHAPNGYLICATNCPWQLDTALRRRFQRQLYVPLPYAADRYHLLKLYTKGTSLEKVEDVWDHIVERTEGYSGSDIEHLVMQALTRPVEQLRYVQVWSKTKDGIYGPYVPSETFDAAIEGLVVCNVQELPAGSVKRPEAGLGDILEVLEESRPTVSPDEVKLFEAYTR